MSLRTLNNSDISWLMWSTVTQQLTFLFHDWIWWRWTGWQNVTRSARHRLWNSFRR